MSSRRKRRPVQVRGVVLDNQKILNEGEADIVSVYKNPDNSCYYVDKNNNKHEVEGNVISYTSRFL